MKRFFFAACIAMLSMNAMAQLAEPRTITVSAEGTAEVTPDVIEASITLSGSVYDQNPMMIFDKLCNDALEALKIKGIAKVSEKMNAISDYDYGQPSCNFFTRTYSMPVASMEEFEKLRSACDNYKKNSLKPECMISHTGAKPETVSKGKILAYENALKNAKQKAELAVKTLGGTLGSPYSITETPNLYPYLTGASDEYSLLSNYNKNTLTYNYSLTVTFELK